MAFMASQARNVNVLFGIRAGLEQDSWKICVHTVHLGSAFRLGSLFQKDRTASKR